MPAFDEDYYLRGPQTGKSNYEEYSWKPDLTIGYAVRLCAALGIRGGDSIFDFGCARGYLVKALGILGLDAEGSDISDWAIENCDPSVKDRLHRHHTAIGKFDWVHSKDVLEHIDEPDLLPTIRSLVNMASKGVFLIVPLTETRGASYIYPADNKDPSHKIRWTMSDWLRFLQIGLSNQSTEKSVIEVHGSYHMDGLKKASETHPFSTGFLTILKSPKFPKV